MVVNGAGACIHSGPRPTALLTDGEKEDAVMATGWLLMPLPTVAAVNSQLRVMPGGMFWNAYVA